MAPEADVPLAAPMPSERLHFLDWLRILLVGFVVYAHLTFCGAQLGRPSDDGTEDNDPWVTDGPNRLAVRYNSIVRQWCIPVLFWISGAASALSFGSLAASQQARQARRRRFCKGLLKVLLLTFAGVGGNACMWLMGPGLEKCSFRNRMSSDCKGKGILFDFTEDPYSGVQEPYLNQMWFTVVLMLLQVMNYPLFGAICQKSLDMVGGASMAAQYLFTVLLYAGLAFFSDCPKPGLVVFMLVVSEALFLTLSFLSAQYPHRVIHYACAVVALFQMGVVPIANTPVNARGNEAIVNDITLSYVLYLILGCNRWFQMGFMMTRPRRGKDGVDVNPLASQVWPLMIVIIVLCMPSTSWALAGVLPYPYFPIVLSRLLYCGGTFLIFFVIDRSSRGFVCRPLPAFLANASMVLYTFQVVFVTVFLQLLQKLVDQDIKGTRPSQKDTTGSVGVILTLSIISAVAVTGIPALCSGSRSPREERTVTASDSEQVGLATSQA